MIDHRGILLFYVYPRMAGSEAITDRHVRAALEPLTDEEAWASLMPLTKLGETLGFFEGNVEVPEDVPYVGIKKCRMDLLRLSY